MSTVQTSRPVRTRIGAAALAGAGVAALALGVITPGQAAADTRTYALNDCINISPNIVDVPYHPTSAFVSEYAGSTYIHIQYNSLWLGVGYNSSARLDWRNLQTGLRGSKTVRSKVTPPNTGVHTYQIPTSQIGTGRVQVTLTSTNSNALWAIPARSCGGTIVTR